jgi:hypothetical protein
MRLLIVVPDQERATGNWVTATRLQQGRPKGRPAGALPDPPGVIA